MEGKLDHAIHAFRAAIAARPDDLDTWRWLARVLRAVNDLPATVAACRRIVALAPDDWQAHHELGAVLMETRAFDEAVTQLDLAAPGAGDSPSVLVSRAKLDAQRGRRADALAALRACAARHPVHVPALAALAVTARDEGHLDESITAFRSALTQAPKTRPCGAAWAARCSRRATRTRRWRSRRPTSPIVAATPGPRARGAGADGARR